MEPKQLTTQTSNSLLSPQHRGNDTLLVLDVIFLIMMTIAVFSLIAMPLYSYIPLWRKYSIKLRQNRKAPCDRCQYFNHNAYLNCALHPTIALTEQSFDCADYYPTRSVK